MDEGGTEEARGDGKWGTWLKAGVERGAREEQEEEEEVFFF